MKVAIVSFGHSDPAISMVKYLGKHVNVSLYYTFALNRKNNNIIDFREKNVNTGLLSADQTRKCIPKEVFIYLNGNAEINLFIYFNLKLRSLKNWLLSIKYFKILRKYDVIHFNGDNGILPFLCLMLFWKKKVFTIHDFIPHYGEKGSKRSGFLSMLFRKYQIISSSNIIIQNKRDYIELLKQHPTKNNKIHYIPFNKLEVYRHFYNSEIDVSSKRCDILFFGRISPYKGIEYLIKAYYLVKEKLPQCTMIIAGGGKLYFDNNLTKEDSGITIINKFLESTELVNLIVNSKIVVCPYIEATQSGVALTAFAFNKPVVASDVKGFEDLIIDGVNGKLVEPKNPSALADAIYELLKDPDKLKLYSENIEKTVHDGYPSWDTIAQEIVKIYTR